MTAEENKSGLQVIGAGVGRTGTMSLKKALEILYGAPCYHMVEVFQKYHAKHWTQIFMDQKKSSPEQYKKIFSGYVCSTDFPSCVTWREQLEAFPDAKVILTVRDPDSWYESCCQTIFNGSPRSPCIGMRIMFNVFGRGMGIFFKSLWNIWSGDPSFADSGGMWDKPRTIELFKKWNNDVKANCPKGKLLEFNVKEGWAPLCAFLGKPIPNVPFPHVNDTAEFTSKTRRMNLIGIMMGLIFLPITLPVLLFFPV